MPRRPNPVSLDEAMDLLFDIYAQVKRLLSGHLGPNNKLQLEALRRALVAVLKRHDKQRLKSLSPR